MPQPRSIVREAIDWTSPAFAVYVDGVIVASGAVGSRDLTGRVQSVAFDHSLTLSSEIKIVVGNLDDEYTNDGIFVPGSQIELYLGYGSELGFVGAGRISRFLPEFPEDGIPILDIRCLDPTHRMAKEEYEITGSKAASKRRTTGVRGKDIFALPTTKTGNIFATGSQNRRSDSKPKSAGAVLKGTIAQILTGIVSPYGVELVIDPDLGAIRETFIRKKGTTDLQICRQLANLYSAEFYLEWDPGRKHRGTAPAAAAARATGRWVAYFRKSREFAGQDSKIIFRWGGSNPTLLNGGLQYAIDESVNQVEVAIYDPKIRAWKAVTAEERPNGVKRIKFGRQTIAKGGPQGPVEAGIQPEEIKNMSLVRLSVEGHGVTVRTPRKFRTAQDAQNWAYKAIKDVKDAFLIFKGETVGIPDLRPGQTHELQGLGSRYSGDYYFTAVTHLFDDQGYRCQFTANKVLDDFVSGRGAV